ncbi:hypothetical protein I552_1173 [Mycobacterium xenopi 3993]|nr:hypothetical protein I552_1173 [Mycobacterium xenopi 3993]
MVGRDLDAFDHPEFGDGTPQFGIDHLGQRAPYGGRKLGGVVVSFGHHRRV